MGLRIRIIILIALAMLPVVLVVANSAIEQRRLAAKELLSNAENFSRIVALYHERTIEGARQMLSSLARAIPSADFDKASCSAMLAQVRESQKGYANIGVIALDGKAICSSIPVPEGVNLSDRPYFTNALKARGFAIGDYQIGRITGLPSLNFGYPAFGAEGDPIAVVFAAVDLKWFQDVANQITLPEHSHLSLIDRNGKVLSRHPPDPLPNERAAKLEPEVLAKILGTTDVGSSTYIDESGARRLVGFARMRVRDTPLSIYAAIATPEKIAFAAIERAFWRNLMFVMIVALVTGFVAWEVSEIIIKRPFNLLMTVTKRLSVGDLTARTNLSSTGGEFGALGHSFDVMADSLQRHIELKRYMSPQIANMIVADTVHDTAVSRRKDVSVLFVDLRGFTAFAERTPPDTVILVLKEFFACLAQLVLKHDGTIGATLGDGMMIYFNDPVEVPNHAQKAIALALAIQDEVSMLRSRWHEMGHILDFGIGVTSGPAIIGVIGFDAFRNYTILGGTVNLASRLCSKAEGGAVLVSGEVIQACEEDYEVQPYGDLMLKGFADPVPVFALRLKEKVATPA